MDDDIKTAVGKNWTQKAEKRDVLKNLKDTHLHQWRNYGL